MVGRRPASLVVFTLGLGACSGGAGGTSVAPRGVSPLPTIVPAATATATAAPTAISTSTATPTASPTATPSATASPSATPTAAPSAGCVTNAFPAVSTTPLPPDGGVALDLPQFGDLIGDVTFPAIVPSDRAGQTVTLKMSNQNFDAVEYSAGATPQSGTPVVYLSFDVSADVTFATAPGYVDTYSIGAEVDGSCEIPFSRSYTIGLYASGSQVELVKNVAPNTLGHHLTFGVELPFQTLSPTSTVDVVITEQ